MTVRFGRLATLALIELMASGLFLAWHHLVDLLITSYGRVLAAKTGMVLLVMLFALRSARAHSGTSTRWWMFEILGITVFLL